MSATKGTTVMKEMNTHSSTAKNERLRQKELSLNSTRSTTNIQALPSPTTDQLASITIDNETQPTHSTTDNQLSFQTNQSTRNATKDQPSSLTVQPTLSAINDQTQLSSPKDQPKLNTHDNQTELFFTDQTKLNTETQLISLTAQPKLNATDEQTLFSSLTDQPMRKRFAYIFYVTSSTYACAALQLIERLTNNLQMDSTRIDVVVMHTSQVGAHHLVKMQDQLNVRTILVEPLYADADDWAWRESLTKLRAFQDWGYDRVVFMDSDAVPMTNLDHLFNLPPGPLYAPTAYWITQPFFASTLLVIEPSNIIYEDIIQWARSRGAAAGFDMDILNSYFADSVQHLSGVYTVLNSDFRQAPSAKSKLFDTTFELKEHVKVVHFSCKPDGSYGKPWDWPSHSLGLLDGAGFDPFFGELFQDYWRGEQQFCAN